MRRAALSILLCTCGVAAGAGMLPQDSRDFRALIEREIPVGTSIQVATGRLEKLGLACARVERGWTSSTDHVAFYFCQRQAGTIVQTRWRVSLLPEQEKVATIRTLVALVGP